jgi:hypothetical protein
VATAALAVGVSVGSIAFSGSDAAYEMSREGRSSEAADWVRGPAAEKTSLFGPTLVEDVYLGLSCPTPNSIECDRVTIAIQILGSARDMSVSVAGQPIEMSPPQEEGPSWWEGSLQPAGLVDGPLSGQAARGDFRWAGEPSLAAPVEIEIKAPSRDSIIGEADISSVTYENVVLHAGFG